MDLKKAARRSVLKNTDSTLNTRIDPSGVSTSKPERRISFSGRKSVREFHAEEKPKSWNDSYEISDHHISLENISTRNLGDDNYGFAKDSNTIDDLFFGEDKCKESIASKSKTGEITFYGNDDISVDDININANRKKLSLLQPTEMDITKYEDCEINQKNANVEKMLEDGIPDITRSFSSKLPAITSESIESEGNSKRTIEAERTQFINITVLMDNSMHIDDSFDYPGLLKLTSCSNTLNNSTKMGNNNDEDLFEYEQCKNNSLVKKTVLKKARTPFKNVMNDPIPTLKNNENICENSISTSKYDYRCLNVSSFSNIGLSADFNSSQCNLSSSMSYNSPLFPPIKCKKLNLRQLNAEIGDGKIVVFPNKNVESQEVVPCLGSNKNLRCKGNNNEIQDEKNLSNHEESQICNISDELKLNEIHELDAKNMSATLEKLENSIHELKFTPHRKHSEILRRQIGVEITDSSSDSFIVANVQKAKAALSSNCKRMQGIEGTPHRSFLEFEVLEREVEQDQLCFETNTKESVQHSKPKLFEVCRNEIRHNEANNSLILNEMITDLSDQFKEKENERDEKSFESMQSHGNNVTTTSIDDKVYNKENGVQFYETGNLDESGLKPIRSAIFEESLIFSPIVNSVTNKRHTSNLTPNLPSPKKRQTLLFHDCGIDETKILSANVALKSRSCKGGVDVVRNIFSESICRDACVEDRKFSSPNECKDLADGDIDSKVDAVNQTENVEEIDYLHINSLHSQIPIISHSNEISGTETGRIEASAKTTELPTHAVTCLEPRRSANKLPFEINDTSNKLTSQTENYNNFKYIFEDNPITISDASVHCVPQQTSKIDDTIENHFPLECAADSTKTAVFNNEFKNLERKISPLCFDEMDDIEKTRLSLVEGSLSENDDADEGEKQDLEEPEEKLSHYISTQHNPADSCLASLRKEINIDVSENAELTTLCRRCKRCQEILSCESVLSASESFALPTMAPFASIGFECLAKLRKCPKLKDVHEYWRRRSLEKKEDDLTTFVEQCYELDGEQIRDSNNRSHRKYFESRIEFLQRIDKQIKDLKVFAPLQTDIAFKNINGMVSKLLPNWILNCQQKVRGIIQLRHTNFISFAIEILFEDRDQLGNHIFIHDISLQSGRIPPVLWKPIDHLLNNILKMSLPLDLKSLYEFDVDGKFPLGLLQRVDEVCNQALEDGLNLWRLLINERATLTRDASRVIIQKITNEVVYECADHYPFVKRTEFQIELTNIQTLSFRDIISPPLYAFCEELQALPCGIEFLKVFLKSPTSYLRS